MNRLFFILLFLAGFTASDSMAQSKTEAILSVKAKSSSENIESNKVVTEKAAPTLGNTESLKNNESESRAKKQPKLGASEANKEDE